MKLAVLSASLCAALFLTSCSKSPQRLVEAGNKYHDAKKYQEASILYRKAITKDKTFGDAYYREALNLLDEGKPGEAMQFFRRAVDLNPKNTDAAVKLSEIYLRMYAADPKRGAIVLPEIKDLDSKILARDPNSYQGLRIQGLLSLANKDLDGALKSFQAANNIKPYSEDLMGWYAQALMASNQGDAAEKLMRDMIAHNKTWGPAYDFLYLVYLKQNDDAKAEAILRERLQNDPTSSAAASNLANYLVIHNRPDEAEKVIDRVLSDPKDFPQGHQLAGDFYFRTKQFDKSAAQYQQGIKDDSKNALHYQQRLVELYTAMGKQDDAQKLAKEIAQKNPKDQTSAELYAAFLLDPNVTKDRKAAIDELKNLTKAHSDDPMLHFDLARAYYNANERDHALTEANEAVRLRPGLIPSRLIVARVYEDTAQHAKALEQTDLILKADPQNPDARLIRDKALIALNEADKARPELEQLVQQYPQTIEPKLELGNVYFAQKQADKAAELYEQVWKANDIRGFIGLQRLKMAQGKIAEAVQAMTDQIAKMPESLPMRSELANFQGIAGLQLVQTNPSQAKTYLQSAAENYKQIIKSAANSGQVWYRLGQVQQALGDNNAALASYEQSANVAGSDPIPHLSRGMLLEQLGKKKEARDEYTKVLAIDPENPAALNNVAYLDAEQGQDLDQAMTMAERAKKRVPNDPNVSDTLGFVYYQKNLNSEALRIFKQNVESNPKNADFRLHLAMALAKQGDRSAAKQEADKALQNATTPDQQNKIKTFMNQVG